MSKSKQRKAHPKQAKKDAHSPERAPEVEKGHGRDDELLHVPKWTSGWRFYVMLGLMIFTLIIFTVPGELSRVFTGGQSASQEFLRWKHPVKGEQTVTYADVAQLRRELGNFFYVQGISQRNIEDADLLDTMIFLGMTEQAGVSVSDREVAKAVLEGSPGTVPFMEPGIYQQMLRRAGTTPAIFEQTLRRTMAITRYQNLLRMGVGLPWPEKIEEAWKESHVEKSFDYVVVDSPSMAEDPSAALPPEEELRAWLDGLTDYEKNSRFRAEFKAARFSSELVRWNVSNEPPAALLERYPAPETDDPATRGREYYDLNANVRFRRPEPLEGAEGRARLYFPYEEVAQAAEIESRVRDAMDAWINELKKRAEEGAEIDLAAEAATVGLEHRPADEARNLQEWMEVPDWGGMYLSYVMQKTGAGGLSEKTVVEKNALMLGKVLESVPAGPPPYEQMPDRVAEEWLKDRLVELARKKLEGVYETLRAGEAAKTETEGETGAEGEGIEDALDGLVVQSSEFEQAVTAAGLEVRHQDWFDASRANQHGQVNSEELVFLIGRFTQVDEEGDVLKPEPSLDRSRVFFVRCAGVRQPEVVDIDPRELEGLRTQAAEKAFEDFFEQNFRSQEALRERFDIRFRDPAEGEQFLPES